VPADGFFEWTGAKNDRRPIWFHDPEGAPLFMAGIADRPANAPPTFAVLTAPARPPIAAVHDRMPLLLSPETARRFLRGEAGRVVAAEDVSLAALAVSTRCNTVANDDPACIEPPSEAEALARGTQLGLF
jgi:putative SOS response-associated peptidase YedK